MKPTVTVLVVLLLLVPTSLLVPARAEPRASADANLAAALASDRDAPLRVLLTMDAMPSEATLSALRHDSTQLLAMQHLPIVAIVASPAQVRDAMAEPHVLAATLDVALATDQVTTPGAQPGNYGGTGDEITRTDLARAMGYDGKGVGLAMVDLGVEGTHPGLRPRALGGPLVQNVLVGVGPEPLLGVAPSIPEQIYVENATTSDPADGHGTHTAGIAAGSWTADGQIGGRAPGADLVALGTGPLIYILWAVSAYDWILGHQAEYDIKVVSNSYGFPGPLAPLNPVTVATKAASDAGMLILFSAGNAGPGPRTLNALSQPSWIMSVGATTLSGAVADFSSRGAPEGGKLGPDLVAPGADIISARNRPVSGNDETLRSPWMDAAFVPPADLYWYRAISGTSMACPQVAGIAALVWQANPNLTATQVRDILISTARPIVGYEYQDEGAGMVDAQAAVLAARDEQVPPRDIVQPTVVQRSADAFVYPFHGAILGETDATINGARQKQFFPVYSPSESASVAVSYQWLGAPTAQENFTLSLRAPDGAVVRVASPTDVSGTVTFDLTADELQAHKLPLWSAAYWTVIVDLDYGAVTYDVTASVRYAGGVLPPVTHDAPMPPPAPPPLTTREAIRIASDADFDAAHGVVGGSGTPTDPFIIQGWDITGGASEALYVGATTASVLVRDSRFHDTTSNCVTLAGSQHVSFENVTIDGCEYGIQAINSADINVADSDFHAGRWGFGGYGVQQVVVERSVFSEHSDQAVVLSQGLTTANKATIGPSNALTTGVLVQDDSFHGKGDGVEVTTPAVEGVRVIRNTFASGALTIREFASAGNVFADSTWSDGVPRYQLSFAAVAYPDKAPANTIVDAGSDHAWHAGTQVCFTDARADVAPPGVAATIAWDFGDGSGSTGTLAACHSYATAGPWAARLSVTVTQPDGSGEVLGDDALVHG